MSLATAASSIITNRNPFGIRAIRCSDSTPRRGFGTKKTNKLANSKDGKNPSLEKRKSPVNQSGQPPSQAPGLNSRTEGSYSNNYTDIEFEERLKAVRRSAIEQKKADELKDFGAIDYDAPVEPEEKTIGVGTKIGIGVAVVVFGLVFALGDFLPSVSDRSSEEAVASKKELPKEEKAVLQSRLKQFEATLSSSPKDPTALEGAAVTLTELGEYPKAASRLEELIREKPNDPDVYRLLGEVKYELKDYEGSVAAYRRSLEVSKDATFEVLRGLTNALLAAKRQDEAVQVLLSSRELLNLQRSDDSATRKTSGTAAPDIDPIQIDLLLGKAYSDWGHISDAVSVYDRLISSHPDDFRGYLAKGIILKENGNAGDAERMFIQARFFAPEKAKALVDRYSRR